MRETKFIEQNKDKWQEFERVLGGQYQDPDKLNDLFVHITDDLSYSRTFYPNRSVRVYLNGLAQRIFFSIYKNKQSQFGRLTSFWTDELPRLTHEARVDFRLSFLLFLLSFLIGALSCAMDPDFVEVILGEQYVEMTMENIRSGDPMAVYKQKGALGMSVGITVNNLYVAFLTFVLGVFFSVGAIVMIVRNAIMVGAFQYFFIQEGLFWESFLTIWIHGTLEISAIIIAGAAGITMGRGLVFPGTYTRLQAFQRSARRGVKIMFGIAPIFILAGFIEGYLTRQTETPDIIRALFILICLAFVVFYFVWYPKYKARVGYKAQWRETRLPPDKDQSLDLRIIYTSGELFSLVFVFLRKHFSTFALLSLVTSTLYTICFFAFSSAAPSELLFYRMGLFESVGMLDDLLTAKLLTFLPLLNGFLFGMLSFFVGQRILREEKTEDSLVEQSQGFTIIKSLLIGTIFGLLVGLNHWISILMFFFVGNIVLLWMQVSQKERLSLVKGLGRTFALLGGGYWRGLALLTLLSLLGLTFMGLLDTGISWFFFQLLSWLVSFGQEIMNEITVVSLTFLNIYFVHLIFIMLVSGFALEYYSLREIIEAPFLKEQIKQVGQKQTIKGLEKE
ncbi:MAG: stage II sporulation protein M [Cyanothece sp. SIO1E1]|nr:stage II sporulation protein M [Cyanothece sp. SIO1E1]